MGADKAGDPGDHDLCYVLTSSQIPEIPPRYTLQYVEALLQDGPPSRRRLSPPSRAPWVQGQNRIRVTVPTTRPRSADTAPGGRKAGASDYTVLRARYSIGGTTG